MNILIVCSGNAPGFDIEINQPFIYEQVESVKAVNDDYSFDYFLIKGHGAKGYLSSLKRLKKQIQEKDYDLIHAHFGLSGVLANLQRKLPVITTYHGCDINKRSLRMVSRYSLLFSKQNIFVSPEFREKTGLATNKSVILPAGVDLNLFYPVDKEEARGKMGLDLEKKYVLFSGSFDTPVKNAVLAKEAARNLKKDVELLELKGYSREEVNLLMNACDCGLLTSLREGSPMFIKELMATNTPLVSVDVGDIRQVIEPVEGCYLAVSDVDDVAKKLNNSLNFAQKNKKTTGRKRIKELQYDIQSIALKLTEIYLSLSKE